MDHPDALAIEKSMMLFLQNSLTPQYTIKDILNCILGHLYLVWMLYQINFNKQHLYMKAIIDLFKNHLVD
jgi:hypothetical protein